MDINTLNSVKRIVEKKLYDKSSVLIEAVRMQEATNILEDTDFNFYKGWMSPEGEPHIFRGHHCDNLHPKMKKVKAGYSGNMVQAGLKQGFARFGKDVSGHYIHIDKKAKGGRQAGVHALNYMKPGSNEQIDIETNSKDPNKQSWNNSFTKRSDAARHLRTESVLNEADPLPRIEKDHEGNPVIPTTDQFREYFKGMAAHFIHDRLEKAHELWKIAANERDANQLKALKNELEAASEVLGK